MLCKFVILDRWR